MAYESTKVVKTLRFPGDTTNQYQVNAVRLDGHTYEEIMEPINALQNFDALRYMGTVAGSSTAPGGFTPAANKGDVYKVTDKGYVMGATVEVGDMLICNTDNTVAATSANYTTVAANWDIIQGNVDVEAILNHTHTGNVTFVKTNKTVSHTVTPSKVTISATYGSGTATVTGDHSHTGSGSVDVTPQGTNTAATLTPAGSVALTSPTTKGTGDVTLTPSGTTDAASTKYVTSVSIGDHAAHNHTGTTDGKGASVSGSITISKGTGTANYTPSGTVGNSKVAVTDVEAGSNDISKHSVSSVSTAGGHTPEGTITINPITPTGTVASHTHSVELSKKTGKHTAVASVTTDYSIPVGATADDGVLTIGTTSSSATYLTSETTITETSVAPVFTGTAVTPTGSFKGTAVTGHSHTVTIADHTAITPNITVTKGNHNHSFTGDGVQLVASHSLTADSHTHGFTTDNAAAMSHSVTAPVESSAHKHTFTGNGMNIHAAFTGTAAEHNHTFTGTKQTHTASVTVNKFTGSFTGSSSGTVTVTNGKDVLNGITINDHSISTVDSGSVTTGKGIQ